MKKQRKNQKYKLLAFYGLKRTKNKIRSQPQNYIWKENYPYKFLKNVKEDDVTKRPPISVKETENGYKHDRLLVSTDRRHKQALKTIV